MTIDAIIFDFDGVIIDTETPDFELWQAFYRSHGLDLNSDLWLTRVGASIGAGFDPITHFRELTGTALDTEFQQAHFNKYLELCARLPVLPGVVFLLEQASKQGLKLAIASSSYFDWVQRFLQQHNLVDYFDCICTRGDVKEAKPAPDLYLLAAECLDVPVNRCIAIEDSPNGMKAALAAGIRCIAVPNSLTLRLARPEVALTLTSLAEFDLAQLMTEF